MILYILWNGLWRLFSQFRYLMYHFSRDNRKTWQDVHIPSLHFDMIKAWCYLIFDTVRLYIWMYCTISSSRRSVIDSKSAKVSFCRRSILNQSWGRYVLIWTSLSSVKTSFYQDTSTQKCLFHLLDSSQTLGNLSGHQAVQVLGKSSPVLGLHCFLEQCKTGTKNKQTTSSFWV